MKLATAFCALAVLVAGSSSSATLTSTRPRSVILFWSDSPVPSLWSVRPDGSHRHRISRTRQNCKRPTLSPDRKWVLFDGTPPGKPPLTDFDIQVMRLDGTGRRTLTTSDDREIDAEWSPEGTRISYQRWRFAEGEDWRDSWVWTIRPDGTDPRSLVQGNSARWSPDGARLVFSRADKDGGSALFVVDADGSNLHRLLATSRLDWPTAWSPDGRKILFTRSFSDRAADVYLMNADGTGVRKLTRARGLDVSGTWSPDGSRIVFSSERLGRTHLFVMRANGTHQHAITRGGANDFDPSWY